MNTNQRELVCEQETSEIIGAGIEVLNTLGHGLLEKNYENALCVEFDLRSISFSQQPKFVVLYKNVPVGEYFPDLIVADRVVVDTKTIERITNHELGQMINYLKITGLAVGLILNFKHARLELKRVVNTGSEPRMNADGRG